jgi:NADH dehydrogenase FAD-containing subunit
MVAYITIDSEPSKAGSVVIKGHDPVPASTVILGVGVKPATGFLKDSGFELEKDGGITVDEYLKVQGHDGRIFAIGDIAHYPQYPEKESRRFVISPKPYCSG